MFKIDSSLLSIVAMRTQIAPWKDRTKNKCKLVGVNKYLRSSTLTKSTNLGKVSISFNKLTFTIFREY